MIQLDLQPEIEAQLAAEAHARGLALDQYVEIIVVSRPARPGQPASPSEAVAAIRELRKGHRLHGLRIKDLINEGRKH